MCKKTIVINYTGRKGGGTIYSYEMSKGLIENGYSVYAIIAKDIENRSKWEKLPFKQLILLPTYSNKLNYIGNTILFKLFGISGLKKKFKNIKVDAVYIPMIQPWSKLINSAFRNCQKIVTVHDPKPHSGSSNYFNRICKKVSLESDDIVILSETFIEYVIQYYGKKKENIHVIPHGIFNYYKSVQTLEKPIKYEKDKINFLFFGRITKYKGLHVLAESYERLSKEFDNISLSVVGDGNFDNYQEEYSKLKNITIVNRWIKDEEVGCFFKGDNIVTVLPYIDATQSGVIPLAMEYKSLVLASNTGGLAEQVKNKETGYLFRKNDVESLYNTMKYVVENYNQQEVILQNAIEFIRSLSWDVLSNKLGKIIFSPQDEKITGERL